MPACKHVTLAAVFIILTFALFCDVTFWKNDKYMQPAQTEEITKVPPIVPFVPDIVTEPQLWVKQIFYNRIPKTGSTSFKFMLEGMKERNIFDVLDLLNGPSMEHRFHTVEKTVKFVNNYFLRKHGKQRSLVVKHLLFLDFNRVYNFNITPVYINHVRSPVERFISNYNYMRFKAYDPKRTPKDFKELPINDCINTKHVECAHPNSTMVMVRFFCGNDPICLLEGRAAVNIAKRNIERHYISVGLLEKMRDSMVVLEYLLPQFFTNLTTSYDKLYAKKKTVKNVTKRQQVPSEKEMLKLKQLLKYDQEIYDFVAHRLDIQYKAIMERKKSQ